MTAIGTLAHALAVGEDEFLLSRLLPFYPQRQVKKFTKAHRQGAGGVCQPENMGEKWSKMSRSVFASACSGILDRVLDQESLLKSVSPAALFAYFSMLAQQFAVLLIKQLCRRGGSPRRWFDACGRKKRK